MKKRTHEVVDESAVYAIRLIGAMSRSGRAGLLIRALASRSFQYRLGCFAALRCHIHGFSIVNPWQPGAPGHDAFLAGVREGDRIWKVYADERENDE